MPTSATATDGDASQPAGMLVPVAAVLALILMVVMPSAFLVLAAVVAVGAAVTWLKGSQHQANSATPKPRPQPEAQVVPSKPPANSSNGISTPPESETAAAPQIEKLAASPHPADGGASERMPQQNGTMQKQTSDQSPNSSITSAEASHSTSTSQLPNGGGRTSNVQPPSQPLDAKPLLAEQPMNGSPSPTVVAQSSDVAVPPPTKSAAGGAAILARLK